MKTQHDMKKRRGKTDWARVKAFSEADIVKRAMSDPDAPLLTAKQLRHFKRVHPPKKINVKLIRQKTQMSQEEFAAYFGVKKRTVQEWEQGRCEPSSTARNFLKVIAYAPKTVRQALLA